MTGTTPTTVNIPQVTVERGGRTFVLNTCPLPVGAAAERDMDISRPSPEVLLVASRARVLWPWIAAFTTGLATIIPVFVFWGRELAAQNDRVGLAVLGVMGALVATFLVFVLRHSLTGRWTRLDRGDGSLTQGHFAGFFRRPGVERRESLDAIVCVQLLNAGYREEVSTTGDPERPISTVRHYFAYQMNLVLDHPEDTRLNLACHADWQWMRGEGSSVAEFLGCPVVDLLAGR